MKHRSFSDPPDDACKVTETFTATTAEATCEVVVRVTVAVAVAVTVVVCVAVFETVLELVVLMVRVELVVEVDVVVVSGNWLSVGADTATVLTLPSKVGTALNAASACAANAETDDSALISCAAGRVFLIASTCKGGKGIAANTLSADSPASSITFANATCSTMPLWTISCTT